MAGVVPSKHSRGGGFVYMNDKHKNNQNQSRLGIMQQLVPSYSFAVQDGFQGTKDDYSKFLTYNNTVQQNQLRQTMEINQLSLSSRSAAKRQRQGHYSNHVQTPQQYTLSLSAWRQSRAEGSATATPWSSSPALSAARSLLSSSSVRTPQRASPARPSPPSVTRTATLVAPTLGTDPIKVVKRSSNDVTIVRENFKWLEKIREQYKQATTKLPEPDLSGIKTPIFDQVLLKDQEISDRIKQLKSQTEKKPIRALTPDQIQKVDEAMSGDGVVVNAYNTQITKKDMRTLQGSAWLNDVIIGFYGQLCINRSQNGDGSLPKVHVFNTFFYEKLRTAGYSSVARWTRKIKLFEKDVVVVPVHLGAHWTCAAINFSKRRFEYYDSMHGENVACLELLRDYIQKESLDKTKQALDVSDWEFYIPSDIPTQHNSYDCGVFACTFMENLCRQVPFTFSQRNMPMLRYRIAYEILTTTLLPVDE